MDKNFPCQESFEKSIGCRFKNKKWLEEALTHKSFAAVNGLGYCNERLEFLGDSILNACVTDFLFQRFPDEDEGKLSKLKSQLVAKPPLFKWAKEIRLGTFLRMSDSEAASGGRDRESNLANAMESLIGAMYLDQGFEKTRQFILKKYSQKKRIVETDYKSKLQEIIQKEHKIPPEYAVIGESGPDHDKTFVMEARINRKALGRGTGKSKKESEQNAAREALRKIRRRRTAPSPKRRPARQF